MRHVFVLLIFVCYSLMVSCSLNTTATQGLNTTATQDKFRTAWQNVIVPPGGQSHHYYSIENPVNCSITITHITKSASAPPGVTINYDKGQSYDVNYSLEVGEKVGTQLFFIVSPNAHPGEMQSTISFTYTSICGEGKRTASAKTMVIENPK